MPSVSKRDGKLHSKLVLKKENSVGVKAKSKNNMAPKMKRMLSDDFAKNKHVWL